MKKTKIWYGNQYVGNFNCDGKRYTKLQYLVYRVKRFIRRFTIASACISCLGWAMWLGSQYMPLTVYAEKEIVKEIRAKAPVMERIAQCESGNQHINPKTGQVYMLSNTNKTVDVGKFMINTVWHKKAKELGLDITKEKDNEEMAYWIYENFGTEAWTYSKKCWSK